MRRGRRTVYLQFVVVSTILFAASSRATIAQTIVLPPGLADTEGNWFYNPEAPYPDGAPAAASGARVQELHVKSELESFGSGPLAIRGLAYRPDRSVNAAVATDLEITALRLSTTTAEPGSLSPTFSENYGDDVTTVFSGTVNLQTNGERVGDAPHDFDYVFDFEHEFAYDPGKGNLLVELVFAGERTWHDGHDYGDGMDRFLLALGSNPTEASLMTDAVSVKQFTIPEPSSAALLVVGLIVLSRIRGETR